MQDNTRRQMLCSGLAAGAMLVLSGCTGSARRPGVRVTSQPTDPSVWQPKSHRPDWLDDDAPAATLTGVLPRSSWTRAKTKVWETDPMNGVKRITIHHDGMGAFTSSSRSAAASRIEAIRRSHVESRGWADIGYHYVVDPGGRVWEGRPIDRQGAHVRDNNPNNLGVLMLGNYDEQVPTSASVLALDEFVGSMMRRYRVPVGRVYTHQEINPTACPGRNLQRSMELTRARGGTLARA